MSRKIKAKPAPHPAAALAPVTAVQAHTVLISTQRNVAALVAQMVHHRPLGDAALIMLGADDAHPRVVVHNSRGFRRCTSFAPASVKSACAQVVFSEPRVGGVLDECLQRREGLDGVVRRVLMRAVDVARVVPLLYEAFAHANESHQPARAVQLWVIIARPAEMAENPVANSSDTLAAVETRTRPAAYCGSRDSDSDIGLVE
ncbi:hypothetical protein GGX14DRAFT_399581 [Mycena pura]|uniref:Uncharacterized protein n=1 Tax=Mycena pura TaxID=153505 RepID=A0AAD6V6T9_9AGAR|nr:hypothetical protein GGX14DRAFT_399581 [Mycena pura]